jgi:rare lipoprotein A
LFIRPLALEKVAYYYKKKIADIRDMKRTTVLLSLVLLMCFTAVHAQDQSASFRQEGIASWYGPGFVGRSTASGEIYDSTLFTAAHPSIAFGVILTVTNTLNNRKVNVRVNDRGPFVPTRIIDLSRAAAEVLDMINAGTARVIVENSSSLEVGPVVGSAVIPSVSAVEGKRAALVIGGIPQLGTGRHYRLQIGAFRIPRHAVDTFERLKNAGLNPAYERIEEDMYRVVLPGLSPEEIQSVTEILFSIGFAEVIIREEF